MCLFHADSCIRDGKYPSLKRHFVQLRGARVVDLRSLEPHTLQKGRALGWFLKHPSCWCPSFIGSIR